MWVLSQEFLLAVDMAVSGSLEEKLRWMFRSFDSIRFLIILTVIVISSGYMTKMTPVSLTWRR